MFCSWLWNTRALLQVACCHGRATVFVVLTTDGITTQRTTPIVATIKRTTCLVLVTGKLMVGSELLVSDSGCCHVKHGKEQFSTFLNFLCAINRQSR